jgi:4-hydroxythreonine-4-phosphate dehydrogenase
LTDPSDSEKPLVAITMGDPAGIGPEIIVKALLSPDVHEACRTLVVGNAGVMQWAAELLRSGLRVLKRSGPGDCSGRPGDLDVLDLASMPLEHWQPGRVNAATGQAAYESIVGAVELAMRGEVDATVTCPIHKEALNLAGHAFAGHTELFAELTGTKSCAMMLAEGNFRVVHVSTHVSLRKACDAVTTERVLATIRLAHTACLELGIASPHIGVAGLNPHAGDGGLFGDEETQQIIPAIRLARSEGIRVSGPLPADTMFPQTAGGAFDAAVAMYHDQGHIPLKMVGFQYDGRSRKWGAINGINITLGLPIIRVSVDHGTACDQAGKGTASEQSLITAIQYAARLARVRRKRKPTPDLTPSIASCKRTP